MIEKLNGIDSADVNIPATIDSINALSLLFGLAMLGLTASCITIKFNVRGFWIPIGVSLSLDVLFGLLTDLSW